MGAAALKFQIRKFFFQYIYSLLSSYFCYILSQRQSVKVFIFEFDEENVNKSQLVKALIQFSVQHFPMKACYQIWHLFIIII